MSNDIAFQRVGVFPAVPKYLFFVLIRAILRPSRVFHVSAISTFRFLRKIGSQTFFFNVETLNKGVGHSSYISYNLQELDPIEASASAA